MSNPRSRDRVPYLKRVELIEDRVSDFSVYPFHLPVFRRLSLEFTTPLTLFMGENGSGKTTLLEAIAGLCGLPLGGGGRTELANDLVFRAGPHARLLSALRPSFLARPRDGYFVRAENLVRLADLLEERARDPDFRANPYASYGGRSLHARSHGEAFLSIFEHRLHAGGVLVMDEPEAALSPQRQLTLLAHLQSFLQSGTTQVFIATHSPILMTFPGATLLEVSAAGITRTRLEDTSHYHVTRGILEHPERYWKHLLAAAAEAGPA